MLLRASARKLHDFSLSMTHDPRSPARNLAETLLSLYYIEVGHTDKVGRMQASELLFLQGTRDKFQDCSYLLGSYSAVTHCRANEMSTGGAPISLDIPFHVVSFL